MGCVSQHRPTQWIFGANTPLSIRKPRWINHLMRMRILSRLACEQHSIQIQSNLSYIHTHTHEYTSHFRCLFYFRTKCVRSLFRHSSILFYHDDRANGMRQNPEPILQIHCFVVVILFIYFCSDPMNCSVDVRMRHNDHAFECKCESLLSYVRGYFFLLCTCYLVI